MICITTITAFLLHNIYILRRVLLYLVLLFTAHKNQGDEREMTNKYGVKLRSQEVVSSGGWRGSTKRTNKWN